MQKRDIYYEVNLSQSVLLLIEALEDSWRSVYNIADGIICSLPGRLNRIYFIGNKKYYPINVPRDFRQNSPSWYAENKNRVMLISPIFEELDKENFSGLIAIICTKEPVDAMDWQKSDILERTLFVNIGDAPLGKEYNQLHKPDIAQITSALNNPAEVVYIKSSDFLPLCFFSDSAKVEAIYDEDKFCLKIYPNRELFNIHITALCEEIPQLKVIRQRGKPETFIGKEEQPWFSTPVWEKLQDELKGVLSDKISKKKFSCPQCKKQHLYNTLICPEGDIILRGLPLNTTILFKKDAFLAISDWFCYPLSDKRAITKDALLYEYRGSSWQFIKEIEPFEEVGDGVFAILHRI